MAIKPRKYLRTGKVVNHLWKWVTWRSWNGFKSTRRINRAGKVKNKIKRVVQEEFEMKWGLNGRNKSTLKIFDEQMESINAMADMSPKLTKKQIVLKRWCRLKGNKKWSKAESWKIDG
jgi:hypothetical protein